MEAHGIVVPTRMRSTRADRSDDERLLELDEVDNIIADVLLNPSRANGREPFFAGEIPYETLLEETEIPNTYGGMRPRHELRYSEHTIPERGVVGQVTALHFRHHQVGIPIHDQRRALSIEQPSCRWKIVAFVIDQVDQVHGENEWLDGIDADDIENGAVDMPNLTRSQMAALANASGGRARAAALSKVRVREYSDWMIRIRIAWAATNQAQLRDPVTPLYASIGAQDNLPPSFMREYAKTRNLDVLSEGARMNRETAKAVIRTFAAEQRKTLMEAHRRKLTDGAPETDPFPPAEERGSEEGSAPPSVGQAQPIDQAAPRSVRAKRGRTGVVSDAKREQIVSLRASGEQPAAIAKRLALKLPTVEKVLEDHAAAAQSEAAAQ